MEPHSRPCSSHNGTLRLPQALVLLLRTALAGPTSDQVTQTVPHPGCALSQNIKNLAYRLASLVNPFVASDRWFFLTLVGMVKLAAFCGIASTLWLWSKRNDKGRPTSPSMDPQHAEAVGKNPPAGLRLWDGITRSRWTGSSAMKPLLTLRR
jgi:hypothetical protein